MDEKTKVAFTRAIAQSKANRKMLEKSIQIEMFSDLDGERKPTVSDCKIERQ
jgi:hypothetical protein